MCKTERIYIVQNFQAADVDRKDFKLSESNLRHFDVTFTLDPPVRVMMGQRMTVPVIVLNTSSETRTIQTNICTR